MDQDLIIVQTTVDQRAIADTLAEQSIEANLAACAQIEGPVQSVYRWKGSIESTSEWRISFKSMAALRPQLVALITRFHPYEVPEIIVLRADYVTPDYAQWIRNSLISPSPTDN